MQGRTTDQSFHRKPFSSPSGLDVVRPENGSKRRLGLIERVDLALSSGRRSPVPLSITRVIHGYKITTK
jgi:hypothetical protein